jgi:SAM-dependent methyltransferase
VRTDMSLRAKWGRFSGRIRTLRREAGTRAALRTSATWTSAFLRKKWLEAGAYVYDVRTGLDTVADFPESERPENAAHDDAVHYARISPRIFARVLKDLGVTPGEFAFVDLGCGKGAALVLAANHGFARVVGVELNDRLVRVAESNAAEYARRHPDAARIEAVLGDVVDFEWPESPTVVFLYNPFGAETLKDVLGNLEASIRKNPRDVAVAYVSPVHTHVLDDSPLFERLPSRSPRWAVYRSARPNS